MEEIRSMRRLRMSYEKPGSARCGIRCLDWVEQMTSRQGC